LGTVAKPWYRLLLGLLVAFPTPAWPGAGAGLPWDLKSLSKAPRVYEAKTEEPGVRALYYESVPFRGRATRVFAYYGVPAGRKLPAMVLVHGGGGTAFAEWVRLWNRRGYAAIAMDTCGYEPGKAPSDKPWEPTKQRQLYGGPEGWDASFETTAEPVTDQWTYHAVAAVILAHSLIRSFPEVNPHRIGVTGISWGGYLTSIVAGVDSRFRFGAPIYGCGYLGDDSVWTKDFQKMGSEQANKWLGLWDPSHYLPNARMPLLWVSGTNDFAYPLDSLRKSYELPQGPRTLVIRLRMPHGHIEGATPAEIGAFADSILKGGDPLPRVWMVSQGTLAYASPHPITTAQLAFTQDDGPWLDHRRWETVPAHLDPGARRVSAEIPAGAIAWYFMLTDDRSLTVTSDLIFAGGEKAR